MDHSVVTGLQVPTEAVNSGEIVPPDNIGENNLSINPVTVVSGIGLPNTPVGQDDAARIIIDAYKDIMVTEDTGENSKRSRKVSEKGKAYQIGELIKQRKSAHNRLMRQFTLVTQCIESESMDMVNRETSNMDRMYDELAGINFKYLEFLDEDNEQEECHAWINNVDEKVFELKTKVCTWLREQDTRSSKSSRSSNRSRSSHRSHCSSQKSRSSRKSSRSCDSRHSNRSTDSIHSIENKAHIAGLKSKIESLTNTWKDNLEIKVAQFQQQEEAEVKQKMLEMKQEIAIAEAKQEVYDQENTDISTKRSPPKSVKFKKPANILKTRKRSTSSKNSEKKMHKKKDNSANQERKLFKDKSQETSYDLADFNQVVVDLLKQSSAPTVELDTFSGNILEFEYFKSNFREMVENRIKDQRGRLTRLLKYTAGEAKDLISGCVHEESKHCYDKAMSLLEKEYGDVHAITCAYLKELRCWPAIRNNDAKGCKSLYRFLLKCQSFKRKGLLIELDSTDTIRMILSRFQQNVQESWNKNACKIREKDLREAKFDDLVVFIENYSRLLNNPAYSRDAFNSNYSYYSSGINTNKNIPVLKTMNTAVTEETQAPGSDGIPVNSLSKPCAYCGDKFHVLESCASFNTISLYDKRQFIFKNRICFACLSPTSKDHNGKSCQQKLTCSVCNESHPTCLHVVKVSSIRHSGEGTAIPIIPVILYHKNDPGKFIVIYAMLDECSQGSFIKESVLNLFTSVPTRTTTIGIETLTGTSTPNCFAASGFEIKALSNYENCYQSGSIELPTLFSQEEFPADINDVASKSTVNNWPHLQRIEEFMLGEDTSAPVGLLIGGDCPKVQEPYEVIPSQCGGPYAYRSRLGWCVVGPTKRSQNESVIKCYRTAIHVPAEDAIDKSIASHHFAISSKVNKIYDIEDQLNKMYMHDFNEMQPEKKALSLEDEEFLRQMNEGVKRSENGHYILPLPFRNQNPKFENNRIQAVSRAESLKKRLVKDKKFHEEYNQFLQNMFDKGYAKKVSDADAKDENVWYIPHHAVYHPTKGKIRVVFNCAAEYSKCCLNKELLQGPDLANRLVGVLMLFRMEEVAFQADITSMFYQVLVPEDQQKYLRFLYWPNGDLSKVLEEYQMCVHIFGATSSTSCCICALFRTAYDNKDKYSREACEAVLRNFYIDDLLKSLSSNSEAIKLILEIINLCKEGGFDLSKFVSNSKEVMQSIPVEKRAKSNANKEKSIGKDEDENIERALGVLWNIENDCLCFRISMKDTPLTRKGMLSTISSIYDPCGLAGPFLLKGRKIMQLVVGDKKGWEADVSEEHASAWRQWRKELVNLNNISINRCYKPKGFGNSVHISLHSFSDASDIGYGQATYLRQENEAGNISVALVMGKSRVAPLKVTTIPRLELVAAKVSVKVAALVKEEIKVENLEEFYYTDSEIVLGQLNNTEKRFRTFIANRVRTIRTYTSVSQWRHVSSKHNPADLSSRGMSADEEDKVKMWLQGPSLLLQPRETFQKSNLENVQMDVVDDPEVIKGVRVLGTKLVEDSLITRIEHRISSWVKMVRVLLQMMKFVKRCKRMKVNHEIDIKEFEYGQSVLVKLIQQREYSEEILAYRKSSQISSKKMKTRIWRLDPFLDEDGVLRVGGRLRKSNLIDVAKHPVILPKSVASKRLAESIHRSVQHSGRTTTTCEIRQSGFWIVNISTCVRSIIHKCVLCRLFRGKLGEQKMADLPEERVSCEGPFVYSGVDMFGPFVVKEKRSLVKRYVAMFTCLSSRAVHMETTREMSTDSFINALRRFLARRGYVKSIRSDNGTNFVGAETELRKAWMEMDHSKINDFLVSEKCEWINWEQNPPSASHMGGVWERQIRTIRSILSSLIKGHPVKLDDESFRTLLCEAENIVNSRPLTPENVNDVSCKVLSPANILTMKSRVVLAPPGDFQKEDVYCRKRWRAVQYLANQFWSQWRKEYLLNLQKRNKWEKEKRNFQPDDVVLIKDNDIARNLWPMGRVVSVEKSSSDGLVRAVDVRTVAGSILRRPIQKLVLLVGVDENL